MKFILLQRKAILFFVDSFVAKIFSAAQIKLNRNLKIKCRKLLVAGFIFFFTSFSLVFCVSVFNTNAKNDMAFFVDIPVDHQIYHDAAKLLEMDGCLYRGNNFFAPYEPITVKEFNHALTTIIRFYKLNFSKDLLLDAEIVNAEDVSTKLKNLAVIIGREEKLRQISSRRFANITRMNLYSILEQVFLKDDYEEPFI
ncbi:MAG: hypothetical protein ACQETH_01460 [Candidatus Rifleibacteriota bacterium]